MGCFWDCIVITCPSLASVIAVEKEIEYFKRKGRVASDATVLTVEDPAENMGSGAATLNALVVATEYLCAQHNYMVVTSDVLHNVHILILHHGRNYLYNSCGKAFISLPKEVSSSEFQTVKEHDASGILTSLENLLNIIAKISLNSPPGIWVCSTDMLLISQVEFNIDWKKTSDATLFCVSSDVNYATGHGTVNIDEKGHVQDIIYCGSSEIVEQYKRNDGRVPLVAGIVFLSIQVAESLLSLHAISPLDSCTYMGLDSGVESIQMSLFFDILVAMATEISKEAFLSGRCGKTYNVKAGYSEERLKGIYRARSLMWEELSKYILSAEIFEHCSHMYWTDQLPVKIHIDNLYSVASSGHIHSVSKGKQKLLPSNQLLINCKISVKEEYSICPGTVISNSYFELDKLYIGKNCFISGIIECNMPRVAIRIPDDTVILSFNVQNENKPTIVIFGVEDNPTIPINHPNSTFSNKPWRHLFITHGISEDDLWDLTVKPSKRTLMNAKLYPSQNSLKDIMWLVLEKAGDSQDVERWRTSPRVSLSELCLFIDQRKEFNQRRDIYSTVAAEKITEILCNNEDIHLLPYFRTACAEGWQDLLITTLDSVLMTENSPLVLTRTLSCMADLLGTMAGKNGGLRSGPGGNRSWASAFDFLMCGSIAKGMMYLKIEREKWLDRPDHLMRAARHYERAAQVLIQNAVKTARKFMTFSLKSLPQIEEWITAECPARIDLQGGWTDTPPICYELGGSVVNVAILVDGKKPVGARARRIKEPVIIFQMGQDDMASKIMIEDLKDLVNYDQPAAQGALLKAAVVCAEMVDIKSKSSLKEQLLEIYKGGLEIQSWSILPQGCGMGTSSILAGAIMAVLWSVSGKAFENLSIVHAVLQVEQLLTTGGGWQDQVGGIMGGINRGYSVASLPIQVKVEPVSVSLKLLATLNKHLLLIYTGKVRLAKNLLQNVIRNWYARDDTIVGCFKDLFSSSLEMEAALKKGNLIQIGALMNRYWNQKKILAPGCEPAAVKNIMEHLAPICYGQMLAGAGGGGFMCILTKQPEAMETVKNIIYSIKGNDKASVHSVTIDCSGLSVNRQ